MSPVNAGAAGRRRNPRATAHRAERSPGGAHGPTWDAQSRDLYLKLAAVAGPQGHGRCAVGHQRRRGQCGAAGAVQRCGRGPGQVARSVADHGVHGCPATRPRGEEPAVADAGRQGLVQRTEPGDQATSTTTGATTRGLAPREPVDTTVFITTTMMSGETSRFTDDYGTLVPDVDHHGLFTFDQDALAPKAGTPSLTALALAARSSASFPGAFEPSFVPINRSDRRGAGYSRASGHGGLCEHDPKPLGGRRGPARQPAVDPAARPGFLPAGQRSGAPGTGVRRA